MSEVDTTPATVDLGGTTYLETTTLNMAVPGTEDDETPKLTGWVLTLAGPAHPATVAVNEKEADRANKRAADKERAVTNGKKWKGDDRTPNEIRADLIANYCARILGWTPAPDFKDGKGPRTYSPETALDVFMDRSKGAFLNQLFKKLNDDKSFLTASAKG